MLTLATQQSASVMARFQPDLQDRKFDWDHVNKVFDDGRCTVRMYHQICLISRAEEASKAESSLRSVWRARAYDLSLDYYTQIQGFVAAMPITLTPAMQKDLMTFGRAQVKTVDNAVMTSPLLAEWKGTKTPLITLHGRRGQPFGFDLFDNTGGNYNFAVAALSGSGKSVFVNELAFRYRASGAKVWIIDVGRSYMNLCELMDGEFMVFSGDESGSMCLNPFSMVTDFAEDFEMLLPLVELMVSPKEELNNFCYGALGSAITQVFRDKGRAMTMTDLYDFLMTGKLHVDGEHEPEIARMAVALEPFTKHGMYGHYFEGEANIDFSNPFIVLELEELKNKKNLQAVVMQIMMYRITTEMYLDRSSRKIVIIDEAWDLMGGGSSGKFIESGYRRARKYGGAFGTITQSVEDYYKTEATKATINNADWLFLLRQKSENIERFAREGKLTLNEWMKRLLASITTDHGNFSEIYVHGPMGSGLGRLMLDKFTMMLFSTRAQDFEKIRQMRERGMTTTAAINAILNGQ